MVNVTDDVVDGDEDDGVGSYVVAVDDDVVDDYVDV